MKYLFLILFSFPVLASVEWVTGNTKFQLEKVGADGYVSKSCLKKCHLKELVNANKKKLSEFEITGGKDPASVLCKEIGGDVTYLSHGELTETFCVKDKDVISLSLLLK